MILETFQADARRPEKAEGTILRNTFGETCTGDAFHASWATAFDRAKLAIPICTSTICEEQP
jgi:hypothetical protein